MNLEIIVKDPLVRGPLALYPMFSPSPSAGAYLTGPEADRMGVLRVAELPGGAAVPELAVHNTGALPLLLVEGETLVGAKQNRTLDASVLIPAGAIVEVPVSCVEAGRWGAMQASSRSARHAPGDLRRVKTSTLADPRRRAMKQSEVWDRIAEYHVALAVSSPTAALEDAYASRSSDVMVLVRDTRPLPEQRGVVVAVGNAVRSVDFFDKATTLAAYWDGLSAGYALDAIGVAPSNAPSVAEVEQFTTQVLAAEQSSTSTAGLGVGTTWVGQGVVGSAIEWSGAIVHLSAFVDDNGSRERPRQARPIRRQRGFTY